MVYPRVCGGTAFHLLQLHLLAGLSPRVRGNRSRGFHRGYPRRSIPACAGEPTSPATMCRLLRVYPRVCGGTSCRKPRSSPRNGLSPRVRGNRDGMGGPVVTIGSIPACAGEPCCRTPPGTPTGVYPRVCGGTLGEAVDGTQVLGLSPRVRGNPLEQMLGFDSMGSIPACAGEPAPSRPATCRLRVYPRVCGGTASGRSMFLPRYGLSPRVRGNHPASHEAAPQSGSIPACAGEPSAYPFMWSITTVYPRVCGGTPVLPSASTRIAGLSPRVRGNRVTVQLAARWWGSIPACAGEPIGRTQVWYCRTVYPRVCGGTVCTP